MANDGGTSESGGPTGSESGRTTGTESGGTTGGTTTESVTDERATRGEWEPIEHRFDALPVHTALLHTGKVVALGGSGNDETRLDDPYPAELFDPESGTVEVVDQDLAGDVFCVGHATLSDGRLLAAGGTDSYDGNISLPGLPALPLFGGLDHAYLFDPEDESWTRVENMDAGRWYPTLVTMGDGSVLCAAGLTKTFPWVTLRKIERYTPGDGWETVEGAGRWLPLYPRFHLLPDGTVFYAGSYNTHYTFPFSLKGFPTAVLDPETAEWTDYSLPNEEEREEGASMLLPLRPGDDYRPRVVLTGGGTPTGKEAIRNTEVIDLGADEPTWRSVEPMTHARYYTYAVLLPTGDVFVAGGRSGSKGHVDHHFEEQAGALPSIPNAVHEAELFDPETETWTTLDAMAVDRLYHSGALLLPDGRVMMCGSNPARRVDELRIETYRPPYLFQGSRPTVEDVPEEVTYGETLAVETPDATEIDEVVLVRPATATHCLTTDQRLVELPVEERTDGAVVARVPDRPNLLPPGYYMLFALDNGVPSEAPFVRVHHGE